MTGERVVIKFGGGLITDKSNLCTAREDVMAGLATVIDEVISQGFSPIIVHGAGSFGHMKAKQHHLHLGSNGNPGQLDAIVEVRADMAQLNSILCRFLPEYQVHPPHEWAKGTGPEFTGDLSRFESPGFHMTFGDVVDCDSPEEFGILSGDDLCYRIATEVEGVTKLIFCMSGADGVLRKPPEEASYDDLIEVWNGDETLLNHDSNIDVTGGIRLKLDRGIMTSKQGIEVYLVNGDYPERLSALIYGKETRCTHIRAR